jgi:hypothetical protein
MALTERQHRAVVLTTVAVIVGVLCFIVGWVFDIP